MMGSKEPLWQGFIIFTFVCKFNTLWWMHVHSGDEERKRRSGLGEGGIRVYSKLSYRQSQKGRSGGSGELVQSWQIATSLRPIARDIKNGAVVGNWSLGEGPSHRPKLDICKGRSHKAALACWVGCCVFYGPAPVRPALSISLCPVWVIHMKRRLGANMSLRGLLGMELLLSCHETHNAISWRREDFLVRHAVSSTGQEDSALDNMPSAGRARTRVMRRGVIK